MAFNNAADTFVVVAGCVLFTVHLVKVARDVRSPAWRKGACETCGKLARLLRSRFSMHNEADDLSKEVADRLLQWQLTQFRDALKVLLFFFTIPIMVLAFSKAILGQQRLHNAAQDGIMVGGYSVLLLSEWCPRLVNERTLDWWYSAIMGMAALYIIPPVCPSNYLLDAILIARMCGALLSLGRMSLPAVIFWNGVHFACDYWAHSGLGPSMAMNFSFEWPVMVSFLIAKIEAHVVSEVRKDIDAKMMQDRQSAGEALSAMFYDVVVELDCNLRIAAPTPKLAAFLIRSTPVPLEHTHFEDLLQDEEDRARFRDLLCPAGCPTASPFVELAHAQMRGGSGTVFQVELFGYRFRGPGGHQRYLVGIREAGDFERGGVPRDNVGPSPMAMSPFDEVAAVINPYGANYPILSSTPGFSLRIIPVAEGTCLMPVVVKGAMFEAWVQKAVNWYRAAFDEEEAEPSDPPAESFEVTFKPRSRNSQMCTRALCKLKVKYNDDSHEGEWDGQITVELAFSCVRQIPGRRVAKGNTGGGGGGSGSSSSSSSRSSMSTPRSSQRRSLGSLQSGQPTVYGARTSL